MLNMFLVQVMFVFGLLILKRLTFDHSFSEIGHSLNRLHVAPLKNENALNKEYMWLILENKRSK